MEVQMDQLLWNTRCKTRKEKWQVKIGHLDEEARTLYRESKEAKNRKSYRVKNPYEFGRPKRVNLDG